MDIETKIYLNRFKPRNYQIAACDAFENKGYKKMLLIFPRRSGKDLMVFNLMIRQAVRKVGVYMYCLPTFRQAKLVIWDSITNDGLRFLDYIPKELVVSMNSQELKITLINGSIIQLIGSDSYDTSLVGTNPIMVVFSEFALADPQAFHLVRPILNANGGSMIIVSTPRGKNTLWELYNIAKDNPETWFCQKLGLNETNHIPYEMIEQDIADGLVSPDLIQQEYYCSFDAGAEGAYYAKYLDRMRLNNQISTVLWESSHLVHTAWDLGFSDSTSIIFFQRIGQTVRIIDCYEKNKEGLEHYVNVIKSKPYTYGKHFAPHDIRVTDYGTGVTRLEKAKNLGISFEIKRKVDGSASSALPDVSVREGIEAVRSCFAKTWIDEERCKPLIKALENYRQKWDNVRQVYQDIPYHDKYSHFADAMRYLALSLSCFHDGGSTPQELEKRYRQAQGYGYDSLGPDQGFFNSDHKIY